MDSTLPPIKKQQGISEVDDTPKDNITTLSLPESFRRELRITGEHWAALSAPLPEEAIQRTSSEKTKKGYDTTGYGYQWVADRFNAVFGPEHWREIRSCLWCEQESFGLGTVFESRIEIGNWSPTGDWFPCASHSHYGGHVAKSRADAMKGGATNAFKKCAAFGYGVGAAAWRDELDDDNKPLDDDTPRKPKPEIDENEWTGEEKVWWGKHKGTPFSEMDTEMILWWRDNMTKDPKIKQACNAELLRRRFNQDEFAG